MTKELNKNMQELDQEIEKQKRITENILMQGREITTLYKWDAPERIFQKREKRWYVEVATVAMFAIILSVLTKNYMIIFVIIAFVVVLFALNTITPNIITHEITNRGLYSLSTLFLWKNMLAFWITRRGKDNLLHIRYITKSNTAEAKEMILLIGDGDLKRIVSLLVANVDYLGEEEIDSGFLFSQTNGKYIPLFDILDKTSNVITKDPRDYEYLKTMESLKKKSK